MMTSELEVQEWHSSALRYRMAVVMIALLPWVAFIAVALVLLELERILEREPLGLLAPIGVIAVGALGALAGWKRIVRSLTAEIRLADNFVEVRAGMLSRTTKSIRFDQVQVISIRSGPFDRAINVRQVIIQSSPAQNRIVFRGIDPRDVEMMRATIQNSPTGWRR